MHILFVCTGNQCRSVMAQYVAQSAIEQRHIGEELGAVGLQASSAGTLHYPPAPADPMTLTMLKKDGIDASAHRSTPIRPELSSAADLILCFEHEQIAELLAQNPTAARKTFLFNDFVNICKQLVRDGGIPGNNPSEKLHEAMESAGMLRPFLPQASETEDPHRKDRAVFERVYAEIKRGITTILNAVA
ncbi:protein tyrosine phosphatase [Bifidobacterium oedipodis]|uniref:Protein-tyrosine-phosphatase n=1 Tax=Bifidobacterium oedipodis TaxID=2675322 RepID=A0A7Y0EP31_9BIFI|nr:protein tyrosine phosphatase [Bifidobacterium sp. DSM 109957]NMM93807.1 protein-tyrosine-phosphatase [Bifidobacterium sp. DSM 109957]